MNNHEITMCRSYAVERLAPGRCPRLLVKWLFLNKKIPRFLFGLNATRFWGASWWWSAFGGASWWWSEFLGASWWWSAFLVAWSLCVCRLKLVCLAFENNSRFPALLNNDILVSCACSYRFRVMHFASTCLPA